MGPGDRLSCNTHVLGQKTGVMGGLSCWLPRTVKTQVSVMPQACIPGEERNVSVLSSQGAPAHRSMGSPEGCRARLV